MLRFFVFLLLLVQLVSCTSQTLPKTPIPSTDKTTNTELSAVETLFLEHQHDTAKSISEGSVSNGSLTNGRILPFSGKNFQYFDTTSYLYKRAFVHEKVLQSILDSYQNLEITCPDCHFGIMECSNEHGGPIKPHRTHQNGLSVDFMTPLLKNEVPTNALDNLGASHYLMQFDKNGNYTSDPSYRIDFDKMALHLLALNEAATANGLKIEKVILKLELKDELFATPNGKKLRETGIYFATNLTPLINNLHDDHYHVDFKIR
ncbi:MAG: penicillin-insensitive murein endopeptidase [Fluviicola sp.]|nr:penicillin-insensitive murein endopeptidase [Fluviicola sp.]